MIQFDFCCLLWNASQYGALNCLQTMQQQESFSRRTWPVAVKCLPFWAVPGKSLMLITHFELEEERGLNINLNSSFWWFLASCWGVLVSYFPTMFSLFFQCFSVNCLQQAYVHMDQSSLHALEHFTLKKIFKTWPDPYLLMQTIGIHHMWVLYSK